MAKIQFSYTPDYSDNKDHLKDVDCIHPTVVYSFEADPSSLTKNQLQNCFEDWLRAVGYTISY